MINGRKGTQMPAFGLRLSPDEVWQVHAFIKSTDHYLSIPPRDLLPGGRKMRIRCAGRYGGCSQTIQHRTC